MQSQGPKVPFQNISNSFSRSNNENDAVALSYMSMAHPERKYSTSLGKFTEMQSIRQLPARCTGATSRLGFDPFRLEDENRDPLLITNTSRSTSLQPISNVVPALWRSGKRKSPDVDERENDVNRSVFKRARLEDPSALEVLSSHGGDNGSFPDTVEESISTSFEPGHIRFFAELESQSHGILGEATYTPGAKSGSQEVIESTLGIAALPYHSSRETAIAEDISSNVPDHKYADVLPFFELTDDEIYFNLNYGGSLESLFEDGDDKSTIIGGRFTEADCTHADAITPLQNPACIEPKISARRTRQGPTIRHPKGTLRASNRILATTWAEIYQPTGIPDERDVKETVGGNLSSTEHPEGEGVECDTRETSNELPAESKQTASSSSEIAFPYTREVSNTIKRLITEKNPTAARRYIPANQGIESASGVKKTADAIKGHDLVVEKLRKPGPRTEVHWCRYRARLIDGEWSYSNQPCYKIQGQNTGYSSWDIAVRHIKEHHFGMFVSRTKKGGKKAND